MSKIIGFFVVLAIVLALGYGVYDYIYGADQVLYKEATVLYNEGKMREAHDKLIEALKIRKTNRKALALKAKVYVIVHNEDMLIDAKKNYEIALNAIDRADYTLAIDKLDKALEFIGSISFTSPIYNDAIAFQKQISETVKSIAEDAPQMYLNKAKVEIARGELERAYNTLTYIVKPKSEAVKLKDDIAFTMGSNEYENIINGTAKEDFFILDAISWFEKVSKSSPNYKESELLSKNLKNMIKGKE